MNDHSLIHDARRYWAMIHKRRAIVFTSFGVSLLVATIYNYTTRPVYQATAQILIDRDTPKVLPNKELVDIVQTGSDYYQTQYQLLRGRLLAERVVEELELQKSEEFRTGPMLSPWERLERRILGKAPPVDSRQRRYASLSGGGRLPFAGHRRARPGKPSGEPPLHRLRPHVRRPGREHAGPALHQADPRVPVHSVHGGHRLARRSAEGAAGEGPGGGEGPADSTGRRKAW